MLVLTAYGATNNVYAFPIETDADKVRFVKWMINNLDDPIFSIETIPFALKSAYYIQPNPGDVQFKAAIYCESMYSQDSHDERVFLVGTDTQKLAFFDMMMQGELDTIFGHHGEQGLFYKFVDARLPMDAEQAAQDLANIVPTELAELIVEHAVHPLENIWIWKHLNSSIWKRESV